MTVGGQSRARRPARVRNPGPTGAGVPADKDRGGSKGEQPPKVPTIYERLAFELQNDLAVQKEVALGRRVGFYRLQGHLGSGNFSQVKLATHTLTDEKVAIKILDKTKLDAKTQRLLSREVSVMERLHHPCVIRLYEVVESVAKIHIVMEYAPGGELFTKINKEGRLAEGPARLIFAQVAAAIKHMHERHVIHRDLKAENVFVAGPQRVKVGDFGFSTLAGPHQELRTFCGSPPYAAPELFRDDCYRGPQVDAWALGVLLYFLLTGTLPFRADTVGRLKQLVLTGDYTLPGFVSESAGHLIASLLRTDPAGRAGMSDVASAAWLSGVALPPALEQRQLGPRRVSSEGDLRPDEREARGDLRRLGIDEQRLDEAAADQTASLRTPVGGAYRIVLHRVHRRATGEAEAGMLSDTADVGDAVAAASGERGRHRKQPQLPSKACSLL